jgi:hypothetical protein
MTVNAVPGKGGEFDAGGVVIAGGMLFAGLAAASGEAYREMSCWLFLGRFADHV